MSKLHAAILLAVIVTTVWPVISMVMFDDSCRDGFWRAYKAHLIAWMAIFGVLLLIFAIVIGFFHSLEVLMK